MVEHHLLITPATVYSVLVNHNKHAHAALLLTWQRALLTGNCAFAQPDLMSRMKLTVKQIPAHPQFPIECN